MSIAFSAPSVIGVVRAPGDFLVDRTTVSGNSTVLEGATVETGRVQSETTLKTGETLSLSADSRARIFRDRLVLERGTAELRHGSSYRIDTFLVNVTPSSTDAAVHVGMEAGGEVRVATLNSSAEVRNIQGMLIARVLPGTALKLSAQGDPTSAHLVGVLTKKNGVFLLTDETTKVTVELKGANLAHYVGKRIDATGTIAGSSTAAGATQLVTVASIKALGAAAAAAGGAAAGAGATTGLSTATIAVIGGVAAAGGTIGGLYAAGTIGGSDSTVSR